MAQINNPWCGLDSYQSSDRSKFYGREKEKEEFFTSILNNYSTILYGVSGVGKTSLINAGLIPKLEDEPVSINYELFLPFRIRLSHDTGDSYVSQIIHSCINAVREKGGEIENWDEGSLPATLCPGDKLWLFFHSASFWSKQNYIFIPVIFFDQFEELFTKNPDNPARIESSSRILKICFTQCLLKGSLTV